MSGKGVHKLLSKREKHNPFLGRHHATKSKLGQTTSATEQSGNDFFGLFVSNAPPVNKEEEPKVKTLREQLMKSGAVRIEDAHILWALRSTFAKGQVDQAYKLLMLMLDSFEGILRDYKPTTKLLGAVNRDNVTCYLDALLFAMFSRLSSFEAMLYNSFNARAKQRLAVLLRLWVNMLRSGELIPIDVTKLLQDAMAECGWADAAEIHQQDASEAFTFITSQLDLPLLTLKMDIYHTGREDVTDDHKFINERLLEVAIPIPVEGQSQTVTLEECLETYFNNRIEVRRYLERRNTLSQGASESSSPKGGAIHIESVEMDSADSPILSPSTPTISNPRLQLRHRASSIVQQRFVPNKDNTSGEDKSNATNGAEATGRPRNGSIRKEVMMPAWQFFSLIPWYTDHAPVNDAQVAAHFSSQRPILGMCLKRYSITSTGKAIRLDTNVDIPVEIGLPYFIQDDRMDDNASIYGNFKLSLQSVVCHRGNSVDSGHYISLVRGTTTSSDRARGGDSHGSLSVEASRHWMRFDDLATERITLIDIHEALQQETPYLLFYQIVPIDGDPGNIADGERTSTAMSDGLDSTMVSSFTKDGLSDQSSQSGRPSMEDSYGNSTMTQTRRSSLTFAEPEAATDSSSIVASRRGSKDDKRTSTLSKLTQRISGEKLRNEITDGNAPLVSHPPEVTVTTVAGYSEQKESHQRGETEGRSLLRKEHKREKSKSRLRGRMHTEGERPDRECILM